MAQQTAVEFYADKQLELHLRLKDNQLSMMDFVVQSRDLLIESKEMFMQQILAAFEEGAMDGYYGEGSYNKEKYYTQAYNK
jgi:hypothetical protein